MACTIKDIAREANVSITTVSRVINNKPDVSISTREKVLNVINKFEYNPNSIARGLVLQKTYTIGLVIPDISNPFFPEVARGVENKAKELGYSVIFCNTHNERAAELEAIKLLKSKQVDGMLLCLGIENKGILDELAAEKFPVVQIDRNIPCSYYPQVTVDNIQSAYEATFYLQQLGHTKLSHITGDLGTQTARERLHGFKKVLDDYGLEHYDAWVQEGDYSKESGYKAMKEIMRSNKRPTAVFAANDLMAIGAYEAVFELGFDIPGDISIVGHDDIDVSSIIRPRLTTMSIEKKGFGMASVEILIKGIKAKSLINSEDVILNTRLVERDSTRELI